MVDRMVENFEERRADSRYEMSEEFSLKIVFSSENPGLLGKTITGATVDVSASGLRLALTTPIKLDSVLDVWISLKENNKKYFLTGNVRWCNESDTAGIYQIGLVLRERSDTVTDLANWKAMFK